MHIIEEQNKQKKRYEGLKPKLIHLDKDTFNILNTIAKMKGITLKKYIELLCLAQAKYEAKTFIKNYEQLNE